MVSIGVVAEPLLYLTYLIFPDWYRVVYSVPYNFPLLLIPLDDPLPPIALCLVKLLLKRPDADDVTHALRRDVPVKDNRLRV